MNPRDHIKYRVRDIVRRALFDFVQHTNANPLTGAADEVENTAVGVVGLLDRDGLIAYPAEPGDTLDPADPIDAIDAAVLIARDILRDNRIDAAVERFNGVDVTVSTTYDGRVTVESRVRATVKGA